MFKVSASLIFALVVGLAAPVFAEDTNYETLVKTFMLDVLKDPDSAQWQLASPSFPDSRGGHSGTAVCYRINAKNAYGGFIGYKLHYFLIENGAVAIHFTPDLTAGTADIEQRSVRLFCKL